MPVRTGSSLLLLVLLCVGIPAESDSAFPLMFAWTERAVPSGHEGPVAGDLDESGPVGGETGNHRLAHGQNALPESYRFARHLMGGGYWIQAVQEFRRFCYLQPDHPLVPDAVLAMGLCYEKAGRLVDAVGSYRIVAKRYPHLPVGREAACRVGEALYRQEEFEEARIAMERFSRGKASDVWAWRARYRAAWASVRLHAFVAARDAFSLLASRENPYREPAGRMVEAIEGITTLSYRSPAAAGILSGLLPGLGHLYAGAWKDGILAFLVNGALIAASVEAWNKEVYGAAGLVSVVGLSFYLGNVYGAINSAHLGNEERLEGYLRRYQGEYEWWRPRESPE